MLGIIAAMAFLIAVSNMFRGMPGGFRDGQPLCAGQPVVTVFAEGSSEQDVEQQLRQRVAAVEAAISNAPCNSALDCSPQT